MHTLTCHVKTDHSPLVMRTLEILQRELGERHGVRLDERPGAADLILDIQGGIGREGFRVERAGSRTRIIGDDERGLLYGAGRFLRDPNRTGESVPQKPVRGLYAATHFLNWYHVASENEIARYIEELALWGINHLCVVFPIINLNGWDDPETDAFFRRLKTWRRFCRHVGIRFGILCCPNQDFKQPRIEFQAVPNRDEFRRKGNHGNNICPSKPGAMDYLLGIQEELFNRLRETPPDFFGFWPYDEGGCGCDHCFPWGANGYPRICRLLAGRLRELFPGIKLILSTWVFDTPPAGEWAGLRRALEKEGNWVDYILADAHEEFPRYPLDTGIPGDLPLLNFPEISMWGLGPWGGFGANPLPNRFQSLWDQVRDKVDGGFPYSEGLFEDMNKVIVAQLYWNPRRSAEDIVREYTAYEFSGADTEAVLEMVRNIEANHVAVATGRQPDLHLAERAWLIARETDARLSKRSRESWRWRIVYLRALLDRERYNAALPQGWPPKQSWADLLAENRVAQSAFRELVKWYHSKEHDDGLCPQHAWVRPPLS